MNSPLPDNASTRAPQTPFPGYRAPDGAYGVRSQRGHVLPRLEEFLRVLSESITHHYLVHCTPYRWLGDVLKTTANQSSTSRA